MPRRRRSVQQEFGDRVRARRQEAGLSQMALAEQCGLHFTFVSATERGIRDIRLSNIVRLAKGLGVDAGELLAGLEPD